MKMTTRALLRNLCVFLGLYLFSVQAIAATRTVIGIGNWSNPSVWAGGNIPVPADDVFMNNGTTITIQNGQTISVQNFTTDKNNGITIEQNASLTTTNLNAGKNTSILVNGTMTINGNLAAVQDLTIIVNGTLNINGNLSMTNNGMITINNGGSMTVTGNVSGDNNFDLTVAGDLQVGGNLSGKNNLTVVIDGNIDVTGNFSGDQNFHLMVDGTGTVGGNLSAGGGTSNASGSGSLIVSGNISGPPAFTGAAILPVTLLYFKATKHADGVLLSWATAAEINNDFFTIEKSADGIRFQQLATIKGAGNSLEMLTYQLLDKSPFSRTYYRLNQTDFDGTTTTFNLVEISVEPSEGIRIFPTFINEGEFYVSTKIQSNAQKLRILGMDGKTYFQSNIQTGIDRFQLTENFTPGIYIIQVNNANGVLLNAQKVMIHPE